MRSMLKGMTYVEQWYKKVYYTLTRNELEKQIQLTYTETLTHDSETNPQQ